MRSGRRWLFAVGLVAVVVAAGGELVARYHLGLGDPPLTVLDPEIEYLFAPGSHSRFGNRVEYNSVHMRAEEPPAADASEGLRVLVLGDSVVNGGALTDQAELATSILQRHIGPNGGWVGNVSAGSWGPANILAYVRRFGWFDADLAVLVLSTHDLTDLPAFRAELGPDFPTERPALALAEALTRYVPRYVPALGPWLGPTRSEPQMHYDDVTAVGTEVLRTLLADARDHVPHLVVVLHPTRGEATGRAAPDTMLQRALLSDIIEQEGILVVPFDERMHPVEALYRDDIHINDAGQLVYGEFLVCLAERVREGVPLSDC